MAEHVLLERLASLRTSMNLCIYAARRRKHLHGLRLSSRPRPLFANQKYTAEVLLFL
jgi:hypothetical protein